MITDRQRDRHQGKGKRRRNRGVKWTDKGGSNIMKRHHQRRKGKEGSVGVGVVQGREGKGRVELHEKGKLTVKKGEDREK